MKKVTVTCIERGKPKTYTGELISRGIGNLIFSTWDKKRLQLYKTNQRTKYIALPYRISSCISPEQSGPERKVVMKKGDYIYTPRFCTVEITEVFEDKSAARDNGFTEPTHYDNNPEYDVLGKHTGTNRMTFAAVRK